MYRFATIATLTLQSLLIFANSTLVSGQTDSIYRLPAGTRITVTMDVELSSEVASANDTFIATVTKPVQRAGVVVLPKGTVVQGRVKNASRGAGGGRSGHLDVIFETLKTRQGDRDIDGAMITTVKASSSQTFKLLSILGGIAAGAAAGAASDSSSGPLIGAAIGGAAGTSVALLRRGNDVKIAKDLEFEIELRKEVILPVLDY
ncbi:MAG: hypothetical protein ABR530_10565 [Pyrinomonadaceae bacterium]